MQREAAPQSTSKVQAETAGLAGSAQRPALHAWPKLHWSEDEQALWHWPAEQLRPEPHCASAVHSTSPATPQALAPEATVRPLEQIVVSVGPVHLV
jgi:hypothetical protein